jgi:tetratricopeptide (TPR) repeat protein
MLRYLRTGVVASAMLAITMLAGPARAGSDPAVQSAVRHLQLEWERIKFEIPEGSEQTAAMNALGDEADAIGAKYPDDVAAQIWDGIITSERAGMANAFSALGLAKRARGILERADKIDPTALDAGAPASLGVLYYRVPGFPIAFGDKAKARQLLERATGNAPNGLDAWYFYGDFLYSQGEYAKSEAAFKHALAIAKHPDRPLWDTNRRLVIQEYLDKLKGKS